MFKLNMLIVLVISSFFAVDLAIAQDYLNLTVKNEESTILAVRKKKLKKRRRRRKLNRKKRRRALSPRVRQRETKSARTFKTGFYAEAALQYFMPSAIDFMPVIEAGASSSLISKAELKHTGGMGINLGAGYRVHKYFGAEFDLFMVYPVVGSAVTLERTQSGTVDAGESAGAKVIIPRLILKGFLPLSSMPLDFYAGGGFGYTQILKTVAEDQEGVALAGMSYHGIVGSRYELNNQIALGASFEYISASYSYLDLWEQNIYDSETDDSVSLSQTIMIFGINLTYTF